MFFRLIIISILILGPCSTSRTEFQGRYHFCFGHKLGLNLQKKHNSVRIIGLLSLCSSLNSQANQAKVTVKLFWTDGNFVAELVK